MEIRCPSCQNINRESAKFCTKCGQALPELVSISSPEKNKKEIETRCPYCQQPLLDGADRCVSCGAAIIPEEKKSTTSKRRKTTSQPRFCTGCGNPVRVGAKFCVTCGKKIETLQKAEKKSAAKGTPAKNLAKTPKPADPVPEKSPRSAKPIRAAAPKRRSAFRAILGVLVVAVIGFAFYRFVLKTDKPPVAKDDRSQTAGVSVQQDDFGDLDGIPGIVDIESSPVVISNPEDTLVPEPLQVSGTKAVNQELFTGLTVAAAENQLDRDRTFTGYRLADEDIYETAKPLRDQGFLLIDAFEFNAGLNHGERLPNGVDLRFDMQAFNIPDVLWEDIALIRLTEDGQVERLPSKRDGAILIASSDANSIIGAIVIGTGIGMVVGKTVEHGGKRSWAQMNWRSYDDSGKHESFLSGSEDRLKNYSIYWPDDLPFTNKEKVKAITKELQALTDQHLVKIDESIWNAKRAGDSIGYSVKVREALVKMKSDPKYKDIVKRLSDPALVIPLPVQLGIQSLVEADYYLYEVRKFKRPSHDVEVYFLDDWPHDGSVLGMSENPYLGSPYIHINISTAVGLPFDVAQLKDANRKAGFRTQIDDLQLTIMHELFHVVQSGYVWMDREDYLWFWEATAVLLEKEAYEYALKNKFTSVQPLVDPQKKGNLMQRAYDDILTTVFWDTYAYSFGNSADWGKSGDVKKVTTNQGYAASHFLETLRDKYYSHDKNKFLKDLIERFAASYALSSDIQGLLRDQLGIGAKTYQQEFVEFCSQQKTPIINSMAEVWKKGGFQWKRSLPFLTTQKSKLEIEISNQSEFTALAQSLGVIREAGDKSVYQIGIRNKNYRSESPSVWVAADPDKDSLKATALTEDGIKYFSYDTGAYAVYSVMGSPAAAGKDAPILEAILLPVPETPQLEIKGRDLVITMPKKSFLFDQKLAENWLVVISMKSGANSTVFALENKALTLEIPLNNNGIVKDPSKEPFKDKVVAATTRYAAAYPGAKQRTYNWDALQELSDKPIKGKPDVVYTVAVMEMTTEEKPFYTQQSKSASIPVVFEDNVGHLEIIPNPCKVDDNDCYFKWTFLPFGLSNGCFIDALNRVPSIPVEKGGSFQFSSQGSMEKLGYTTSCNFSINGVVNPDTKKGTATLELNMIEDYYMESDKYKPATGCTSVSISHYEYELAGKAEFDLSEKGGFDFEVYPDVASRMPSDVPLFYLDGIKNGSYENTCSMFTGNSSGSGEEPKHGRAVIRFKYVPGP